MHDKNLIIQKENYGCVKCPVCGENEIPLLKSGEAKYQQCIECLGNKSILAIMTNITNTKNRMLKNKNNRIAKKQKELYNKLGYKPISSTYDN